MQCDRKVADDMRTHTEILDNYLNSGMRKLRTKISCSAGDITEVQSVDYKVEFGDSITIGNTVSACISLKCETPAFSLSGREITLFFGTPDTWTQIGKFTILPENIENRMGYTSFTAYDKMYANTREIYNSQLTYPAQMSAVLAEICSKCGMTAPAITSDPTLNNDYLSGYNLRDAIGFIAGYQGKNAYIDVSGNLVFKWFENCEYTADGHKANIPYADEKNITIKKVICSTGKDTIQSGNGSEGIIFNNPIMTSERLGEIQSLVENFSYRRIEVDIPVGNYLIESGDIIKLTSSGEELTVPVMSMSIHYDGGISCKLQSYGVPDSVTKSISAKKFTDHQRFSSLQQDIVDATNMITGATGGYLRINFGDDGKTAELLIMDQPNTEDAVNVWRFNKNGLGHSHNGYDGPYDDIALTADGHIVADRIAGNQISGVVIRTTSPNEYPRSYAKLMEGGMVFYTPSDHLVGSIIEVWEGNHQDTAGVALLSDKNRWISIGKYVDGGGWFSEFTYRPNGYDKFWLYGNTKIEGQLKILKYGTDNEYDDVASEIHFLRQKVSYLEEALSGSAEQE